MERRKQVEQGKHPTLAQRVQDLVHAGDRQLTEAADLVKFLVVDVDPNASTLLRDGHQRVRIRRARVLDRAGREVLIQSRFDLAKIRLIWWGREETAALFSGTKISKGIREQQPKSVLDLEKTSAKSRRTSPSCSIANGLQSGP